MFWRWICSAFICLKKALLWLKYLGLFFLLDIKFKLMYFFRVLRHFKNSISFSMAPVVFDIKKSLMIFKNIFFPACMAYHFSVTGFNFIFLLYNTVLVLPYIDMNLPRVYMSSQSWGNLTDSFHPDLIGEWN